MHISTHLFIFSMCKLKLLLYREIIPIIFA
nr:MAG TPA: hypothetical protein [Caudoviricetes sp.]